MYDSIIIGGSAAGAAAAVYLARRKLDFKLVTQDFGGEVARSGEIENYPGFARTDGIELTQKFREQLEKNGVEINENVWVEKISFGAGGIFELSIKKAGGLAVDKTRTVIIATGVHPRKLDIPGENQFRGKGVSYCTVCDGPLYRGKTVAVAGGGNSALEAAIMLAALCPKVYVLTINPRMQGEQVLIDKLKAAKNVEIIASAASQKILGEEIVGGLEYKDKLSGIVKKLAIQGVFVHIGFIPNSGLVDETIADKSQLGNIVVDNLGRTKTPGLFAAGDVIDFPYQQIAISAGQGVAAALTCINYLNSLK